MFERFTERARQVVVLAQDAARGMKHNYIGTEHLLVGLLREEEGLACRVLEALDLSVGELEGRIRKIVGEGNEVAVGQIPFTPRAKKCLELALREALSLGHNYIGTEHVLLGLVREREGVAARLMEDFVGDDYAEKIRHEVIRILSGPGRRGPALEGPPAALFMGAGQRGRVVAKPVQRERCVSQMSLFGTAFRCQGVGGHEGAHWEQGSTGDGDRWMVAWS